MRAGSPWQSGAARRKGEKKQNLPLLVPQRTGYDHVVASCANGLVFTELCGTHDRLADVQQFAVPPHLFGRSSPPDTCTQALNELFPIHPSRPPRDSARWEAGGV